MYSLTRSEHCFMSNNAILRGEKYSLMVEESDITLCVNVWLTCVSFFPVVQCSTFISGT